VWTWGTPDGTFIFVEIGLLNLIVWYLLVIKLDNQLKNRPPTPKDNLFNNIEWLTMSKSFVKLV